MNNKLQTVQKIVNKISTNKYLNSVSDGIMQNTAIMIVGAIFSLLSGIPNDAYQGFLANTGLSTILKLPTQFTTNIIAIYAVFFIGSKTAENFNCKGANAGAISLLSFFMVTPLFNADKVDYMSFQWLGTAGFFVAIIIGLVVGRMYAFIVNKGMAIKMPAGVPPTVEQAFTALVPAFIIVPIFSIISFLFGKTSFGSMHGFVYNLLQVPLQGLSGSFAALLLVLLISHLLWIFGIHGAMVTFSVMAPIWLALDMANLAAYNSGESLPNIVGLAFYVTYCVVGGSGVTFGLNLYMSFKAKSKRYKTLGRLSLPAGICGINEPIIFGTPIVMNPKLAIPFITAPIVSALIAYVATVIGIVPRLPGIMLPIGTPIVVQGFLQGGWKIAAMQIVMVVVSVVIYYPFIKSLDKEACLVESNTSEEEVDFSDINAE